MPASQFENWKVMGSNPGCCFFFFFFLTFHHKRGFLNQASISWGKVESKTPPGGISQKFKVKFPLSFQYFKEFTLNFEIGPPVYLRCEIKNELLA